MNLKYLVTCLGMTLALNLFAAPAVLFDTVGTVDNFQWASARYAKRIDMPLLPKMSKGLRLYLHSGMIEMKQKIEVVLNGKLVATRQGKVGNLRVMDVNDSGFKFEDTIDIKL